MLDDALEGIGRQIVDEAALVVVAVAPRLGRRPPTSGWPDTTRVPGSRVPPRPTRAVAPRPRRLAPDRQSEPPDRHDRPNRDRIRQVVCVTRPADVQGEVDVIGCAECEVAERRPQVGQAMAGINARSARDHRLQRVKPVLEGRHNPEVGTCAAHAPEQIRVLGVAGTDVPAVGGDQIDCDQVVDGQSKPRCSRPIPPPSVRPPTPVWPTTPTGRQAPRLAQPCPAPRAALRLPSAQCVPQRRRLRHACATGRSPCRRRRSTSRAGCGLRNVPRWAGPYHGQSG